MECDHLAINNLNLLTRIGNGEAMLVWRLKPNGGVFENPVGEVQLTQGNEKEMGFVMKGVVLASEGGEDKEELVMMSRNEDYVKFSQLSKNASKM